MWINGGIGGAFGRMVAVPSIATIRRTVEDDTRRGEPFIGEPPPERSVLTGELGLIRFPAGKDQPCPKPVSERP